jgi:hypothetical protein
VGALFNASFNCDEAKAVLLTSHSQLDPRGNPFKLYNMIKARFSKKNQDKLQSMINDLMGIEAQVGEEPTALVDRMEKMCVAISAITDSAQLPMEFALVGALKKAVKIRFKLLTSGIKLAPTEWTLPLLKIKLRDWNIENEIMSQPQVSEKAHFTPAGRGRDSRSFKNRNQQR